MGNLIVIVQYVFTLLLLFFYSSAHICWRFLQDYRPHLDEIFTHGGPCRVLGLILSSWHTQIAILDQDPDLWLFYYQTLAHGITKTDRQISLSLSHIMHLTAVQGMYFLENLFIASGSLWIQIDVFQDHPSGAESIDPIHTISFANANTHL